MQIQVRICQLGIAIAVGILSIPLHGARADDVPYLSPQHNELLKEVAPTKSESPVEGYVDPTTTRLSEFVLGSYQYCGEDRDCIVATNGCCDCANGGEDVAISTLRSKEFRNRFECAAVKCGVREAVPPCGGGLVSCVHHKCRYTPPQKE